MHLISDSSPVPTPRIHLSPHGFAHMEIHSRGYSSSLAAAAQHLSKRNGLFFAFETWKHLDIHKQTFLDGKLDSQIRDIRSHLKPWAGQANEILPLQKPCLV